MDCIARQKYESALEGTDVVADVIDQTDCDVELH